MEVVDARTLIGEVLHFGHALPVHLPGNMHLTSPAATVRERPRDPDGPYGIHPVGILDDTTLQCVGYHRILTLEGDLRDDVTDGILDDGKRDARDAGDIHNRKSGRHHPG